MTKVLVETQGHFMCTVKFRVIADALAFIDAINRSEDYRASVMETNYEH